MQLNLVASGVSAEPVKRLSEGDAVAFGENALGLFEHDTAGQRGLQLHDALPLPLPLTPIPQSDRRRIGEQLRPLPPLSPEPVGGVIKRDRAQTLTLVPQG